jgi:four helix bundle protein
MGQIKRYKDLLVWQKSMNLVTLIYEKSKSFPKEDAYGLTSQIRRCAVSIPSNIAEGYGRRSSGDYIRFLRMASGSLYELQTQMEIAKNLCYLSDSEFQKADADSIEIEKMLCSMISKLLTTATKDEIASRF